MRAYELKVDLLGCGRCIEFCGRSATGSRYAFAGIGFMKDVQASSDCYVVAFKCVCVCVWMGGGWGGVGGCVRECVYECVRASACV